MRHYIAQEGWEEFIVCASAGTLDEHEGEKPDPRMIQAACRRGYALRSRARQFQREDFDRYDLILAADRYILRALTDLARTETDRAKLELIGTYHPERDVTDVPDPYYGGPAGFEHVLDMLELTCRHLLDAVVERHDLRSKRER